MKLDKIKFAEIVSWFGHRMKSCMTADEIRWLDEHIDINVEPVGYTKEHLRKYWERKPMQQLDSDIILKFIEELD